ncbi:MAG TPA: hypothetical protein VFU23_15845, partial [Gemmatimonadales bacterium]|nr:hypothetical protein [Gemmatimonadales bacterium]
GLARQAARQRAADRMRRLSTGMEFLRRGHTAGELRMVERWIILPERELLGELGQLPVEEVSLAPMRIELIGLLLLDGPPSK